MIKNQHTNDHNRAEWIDGLILGIIIGVFSGLFITALLNWVDTL
jgi:hypothetical protein